MNSNYCYVYTTEYGEHHRWMIHKESQCNVVTDKQIIDHVIHERMVSKKSQKQQDPKSTYHDITTIACYRLNDIVEISIDDNTSTSISVAMARIDQFVLGDNKLYLRATWLHQDMTPWYKEKKWIHIATINKKIFLKQHDNN